MAMYACTYFFEGFQESQGIGGGSAAGWTETYYTDKNVSSADAALNLAVGAGVGGDGLLAARVACLNKEYHVAWIRVANVDNPNDVKVANVTNTQGQQSGSPAQVTCAILFDIYAPPAGGGDLKSHHRRLLLRGLSEGIIFHNTIQPGPEWTQTAQFMNKLAVKPAGGQPPAPAVPQSNLSYMRVRDPATAPKVAIEDLLLVAPNNNKIDIKATALGALAPGQKVEITGVKVPTGVNRVWTAEGGAPANYVRLGGPRRGFGGIWNGSGRVNKIGWLAVRFTQWTVIGLRARKTGSPFRQLRGRSSGE